MSQNNGGPAFSSGRRFEIGEGWQHEDGMSLRDYFAAKAMQAIISTNPKVHVTEVSRIAFLAADAMIMERNK